MISAHWAVPVHSPQVYISYWLVSVKNGNFPKCPFVFITQIRSWKDTSRQLQILLYFHDATVSFSRLIDEKFRKSTSLVEVQYENEDTAKKLFRLRDKIANLCCKTSEIFNHDSITGTKWED